MDSHIIQKTKRHSPQKILLFKNILFARIQFFIKFKSGDIRNSNRGFVGLELVIWTTILLTIVIAYFSINGVYVTEQLNISKDYTNEWNNINSKR